MKDIVIIGAGFAGLRAALNLEKKLRQNPNIRITLVDRESYHLFAPFLYEVATNPEELTAVEELRETIALPIAKILQGKRITFLQGVVTEVCENENYIVVSDKKMHFDFLIQALGSQSNYYHIPGADTYAFPLKTLRDALKIRNRIEFLVQAHRQDITKQYIRIGIAGGGFLGVEIAAELAGYLDFLAWKNQYPRSKLQVVVIEAGACLLPGMDTGVAAATLARLQELGVSVLTNHAVSKVEEYFVEFANTERLEVDCLIWAAGVRANSLPGDNSEVDRAGRAVVCTCLEHQGKENILYIGDQACVLDEHANALTGTIPHAESMGRYAAFAVTEYLQNKRPHPFVCDAPKGYFIAMGGRWALCKSPHWYLKGRLAYILRTFVYLRYYASILGWYQALRITLLQWNVYGRNN
jgi:NADH:ubiquinone reductase (H+-translocating)